MRAEKSREDMRRQVLDRIGIKNNLSDREIFREIDQVLLHRGKDCYDRLEAMGDLRQDLFDGIRRFGRIEKYLRDDRVSEIMVTGPEKIFIERDGVISLTGESFTDKEEVRRLIDRILAPTNRTVNESRPIADSRLPDGSRVHIVLPPIALDGPVITIRKFLKGGMTLDRLAAFEEFPRELLPVLRCLVRGKYSILISGATNSGKSSLLNALGEYIGGSERILTIEDSAELQLFHVENLVRLETRDANSEGMNEVSMKDLIKASLRMRPDRIIVGEVRGEEAMSMLQALSTGHSGSFSTIHANSCRDALRRLETMVLMGVDMPLRAIQGLIASSIDILIHLGRESDGRRRLMEMTELMGFDDYDYLMNPLFHRACMSRGSASHEDSVSHECLSEEDADLRGRGSLLALGELSDRHKLLAEGMLDDYEEAMEAYRRMENSGSHSGSC